VQVDDAIWKLVPAIRPAEVIVADVELPLGLASVTVDVPLAWPTLVLLNDIDDGVTVRDAGVAIGVGVRLAVGLGVGFGLALGLAVGFAVGLGLAVGFGVGVAVGLGCDAPL
jgi:hypothetical protein